jgi:hypothetical protein
MNKKKRAGARNRVDTALEDSFPASDPPSFNMGAERSPERPGASRAAPRVTRSRRGNRAADSRQRAARGRRRLPAAPSTREMESTAFPGGWRLLSPGAWLRWLLRRGVRPADQPF